VSLCEFMYLRTFFLASLSGQPDKFKGVDQV
jgi:hypothetical protein